eukprot:g37172.t1
MKFSLTFSRVSSVPAQHIPIKFITDGMPEASNLYIRNLQKHQGSAVIHLEPEKLETEFFLQCIPHYVSVAAGPATYFLGNTSVRLVTKVSHYFAPPVSLYTTL